MVLCIHLPQICPYTYATHMYTTHTPHIRTPHIHHTYTTHTPHNTYTTHTPHIHHTYTTQTSWPPSLEFQTSVLVYSSGDLVRRTGLSRPDVRSLLLVAPKALLSTPLTLTALQMYQGEAQEYHQGTYQ